MVSYEYCGSYSCMQNIKSRCVRKAFFLCVLPLLVGACIYVLFRREGLMGFSINEPRQFKNEFARILINTIPDFCWSFSLVNALYLFAKTRTIGFWKTTWLAGLIIILSEAIQLLFPRSFTFDMLDLIAAILAFLLSFLYFKRPKYELENR